VKRGVLPLLLVACAAAGLLAALLVTAAPTAIGQTVTGTTATGTTTGTTTVPPPTTTTTTTTAPTGTTSTTPLPPPPRPKPTTISAGVTIGGDILVGGLSPKSAALIVRDHFARPLTIRVGKRTLLVTPRRLGALAHGAEAIRRARLALPGRNVPLEVTVRPGPLERYVEKLARRFDRAPVESKLFLRGTKPFLTKHKEGRALNRLLLKRALVRSLKAHERAPIAAALRELQPAVSRSSFTDVIVIRRGANKLSLYNGMKLRRTFGIATGQAEYPTPLGRFQIIVKWRDPWWYPPSSDWAKDAKPIPPGPGNPLGTRWMGISSPAVGIHGTPDAASIGYSASHGCIRMLIDHAEWLFEQVEVGTPVFIIR
jgi:L,D-transpeptidase catalytic domain/Putative peptidoglycan binding domain